MTEHGRTESGKISTGKATYRYVATVAPTNRITGMKGSRIIAAIITGDGVLINYSNGRYIMDPKNEESETLIDLLIVRIG